MSTSGPKPWRSGTARCWSSAAPAPRPEQAHDQLPPRHRLAGAQAGGVRGVSLPGRHVPHEPVPHGLRRLEGTAAPGRAAKDYLRILHLAAQESEAGVDAVLGRLLEWDVPITPTVVAEHLAPRPGLPRAMEVIITKVDLTMYDRLLESREDYHEPTSRRA